MKNQNSAKAESKSKKELGFSGQQINSNLIKAPTINILFGTSSYSQRPGKPLENGCTDKRQELIPGRVLIGDNMGVKLERQQNDNCPLACTPGCSFGDHPYEVHFCVLASNKPKTLDWKTQKIRVRNFRYL